ncbi:metal-sulfur cluster assembly factor [Bifidobacterium tibiigranuli]|jgi:metal-sulfur cluster biosynthetic enzyme|uniref:metal-sulfur cluster assembly factor n=1 Tax=Bifidobacterium tibiigranuli TaxID=2172043 RepID=UPI0026EC7044|nr:metal-sulfur cluster assembly factor [Bifidobacterium tibiigranuli]MCI1650231.1 metal-sulfur cluster assembly factor [Bifidobacterium tibiigranuli]MCI1673986.1 metal-sulfur cluster assembly factor [Bifidobacterium tibiigranuli]MCI1714042.1 metal-sulfur cluster assembly factor [Bifidobacterium tibiigranuli]MCI1833431.1 metal-sulfur cluster assembly factor [Bifidobacterium tibiigranuli]MCI2185510.1 metal-sulfur cluster assembly factor [Bifidobacterium tibiigranuli]
MSENNLVPEPQSSIFDSINHAVGDEKTARQVFANPQLAGTLTAESNTSAGDQHKAHHYDGADGCCGGNGECGCEHDNDEQADSIPLTAVDDIGRATAADIKEALHQVIDPELGIDVIDLGLVYGIEVDEQGRAIIRMTLTTPACPLTDLIEDECASTLAGLVEEFRIDWTWDPLWTIEKITPEGRDQLAAIGFNFANMPKY